MPKPEPKYMPLADVFELVTGHRPSPATLSRMQKSGRLKTWLINNKRMTTREEVQACIDKTQRGGHEPPTPTLSNAHQASLAALEAELNS